MWGRADESRSDSGARYRLYGWGRIRRTGGSEAHVVSELQTAVLLAAVYFFAIPGLRGFSILTPNAADFMNSFDIHVILFFPRARGIYFCG